MAYGTDRERVEAWPLKGTVDKLKAKAKRLKRKSYSAYVTEVLEEAAKAKRVNPETDAA